MKKSTGNVNNKPKYVENEKVLCYHGPLIYEAKCIKSRIAPRSERKGREKEHDYFIHYAGWNKSWDEWVPEFRVLKYNAENLKIKKAKDLTKIQAEQSEKRKKGRKSISDKEDRDYLSNEAVSSSYLSKKEKQDRKSTVTINDLVYDYPRSKVKTKIELKLTNNLNEILCDDAININMKNLIIKIPHSPSLEQTIADFIKDSDDVESINEPAIRREIMRELKFFLELILETKLLYSNERQQFKSAMSKNDKINWSSLVGPIHILRALTILPWAFGQGDKGNGEDKPVHFPDIQISLKYIRKFVSFLDKNSAKYFSKKNYVKPSS